MDQEAAGHKTDAWSDVREGAIRKFCFVEVDLAGYSEIVRSNSTRDVEATFGNFLDYIEEHVQTHGGHTWRLAGDGGLFAFYDDDVTAMAEQGVASALAIVNHLDEFNGTKSQVKQRARARVAVHFGDARYLKEAGRIQSDDINFVTHLEKGRTDPDSVSISENVYRELTEEMRARFRDNGTFEGHRVYTSAPAPVGVEAAQPAKARFPRKKSAYWYGGIAGLLVLMIVTFPYVLPEGDREIGSIAVLPLENLMGDPEQEYFVDGMHEALITRLSKIGALKIISRTSVMRYKKTDKSLPEIARELGVDAIIEGSVFHTGDQVRITAQLIHGTTDEHLWAESYDRDLRDVLALQSEVARAIAREIKVTVTPTEETRLASARRVNPETYEAYLKGMFYVNKLTPEGFEKGLSYLHQAVEKDPADPLAYAGLALGYAIWGHEPQHPPQALPRARAAALKALELDETLAEAHEALAEVRIYYDWDLAGAERSFQRALELDPNLAVAHGQYAWFLTLIGRWDEALAEQKRAQALDPLAPVFTAWLGWMYLWRERYEDAIVQARKSLELDPGFPIGHFVLGTAYAEKGMYEEAIAAHKKAGAASQAWGWGLGVTYACAGRNDEARMVLNELEKEVHKWDIWGIAEIYATLGDKDGAFRWLEAAYEQRHTYMPWLNEFPAFEPLRDDPRFQDLLQRIRLPENETLGN